MLIKNLAQPDPVLVTEMRLATAKMDYDGRQSPAAWRHIKRCTRYHLPTLTMLLYTRDAGMHTSGWWKNPDYDRCKHLSISFIERHGRALARLPHNHKMAAKWCELFFGDDKRLLWIEPPFSEEGKAGNVYHYRLFCDRNWEPIKPRGEVYNKTWTPEGWLSWSDLHAHDNGNGEFGAPNQSTGAS